MNFSRDISLLKSIDVTLTSMNNSVSGVETTNALIQNDINNVESDINTIKTNVGNIKSEVETMNKTKIKFNARLTDGTNEYLTRDDYFTTPINFYWQNDKGSPAYITRYKFCYTEANEPTAQQLYHSTAWDSKIGAMNSAGDDYEAPYITVKDNQDYFLLGNTNDTKKQWVSNISWFYPYDFEDAQIEIGISQKFGHVGIMNALPGKFFVN